MLKKIIAANWKLHKTPQETRDFFSQFVSQCQTANEVIFFPTAVCLEATSLSLKDSALKFGLQNVYSDLQGAFTGENSVVSLKALNGTEVLIGHSERRTLFAEKDSVIAKKVKLAQEHGLRPMLCIGETLAERDAGQTNSVLEKQIQEDLALADKTKALVIAYEPVWAIGTGRVATTEQIKEAHAFIVQCVQKLGFSSPAVLYGGSVKPETAQEILSIPHVSGLLVGGASLQVESFLKIATANPV